jgi:glycosyltransferase involved in cell wall biosynthesis
LKCNYKTTVRILHIIKSLGRGGAETLLPETLKLHDHMKFEFHYIYFLPWKDQMVSSIEKNGGTVTCLSANNNIRIILKWREVEEYIRTNKIDIIHTHLPWAGFLGRLIHRRTGIPVLYTEHNKQERYHLVTKILNRLTFNSQSAAIGVSSDVASSIQKNIHPVIPIHEVLNGVNTDKYKCDIVARERVRKELGLPDTAIVVGTVAVFRFQKRLKEWLNVFKAASASQPYLHGIIVGDGPLKEEIMLHRKTLGLEGKIFMAGLQTNVIPWVSAMDIYMMTSVFEGLPIALLEAMSMECAVCTTEAGGIKELVRDNVDGLTAPIEDLQMLRNKLLELCEPQLLKKRRQAARQRVEESFSLTKMVTHLEDLYQLYSIEK